MLDVVMIVFPLATFIIGFVLGKNNKGGETYVGKVEANQEKR